MKSSVPSRKAGFRECAVRDQVEGDVEPIGLRRDRVGVPVDRLLVECVDLRGLGRPSLCADRLCDRLEPGPRAAARKTFAPSRAKASATAPPMDPAPP
jgi:hypothetical protein